MIFARKEKIPPTIGLILTDGRADLVFLTDALCHSSDLEVQRSVALCSDDLGHFAGWRFVIIEAI